MPPQSSQIKSQIAQDEEIARDLDRVWNFGSRSSQSIRRAQSQRSGSITRTLGSIDSILSYSSRIVHTADGDLPWDAATSIARYRQMLYAEQRSTDNGNMNTTTIDALLQHIPTDISLHDYKDLREQLIRRAEFIKSLKGGDIHKEGVDNPAQEVFASPFTHLHVTVIGQR